MRLKEYLSQAQKIKLLLESKRDLLSDYRKEAELLAKIPGEEKKIRSIKEKIKALEDGLVDDIESLCQKNHQIHDTIQTVKEPEFVTILERHYLLGETWEQIAEKIGYSERHVRRLHERALQHVLECPLK